MTMFRMPIFTWNILLTSLLALLAFPVLTAALLVLETDRKLGAQVFAASSGGAILWQHLFWFFGHPEVYIVALPFFGIATEVLPVFSRKPCFGYKGLVGATIAIAGLSLTVWAHHMFTTGAVLLPFFSFMTFLIAVPTGVKFFNWVGTIWRGQLSFEPAMLFILGFLVVFLFGGLTGIILASPPLDFAVSDSYFVVAHFHYVLFGTVVFCMFGGFYFWWPKFTGKMLNSTMGKWHFWLVFIGFNGTFLVQHWLGVMGMPRRVANYPYLPHLATTLNDISSIAVVRPRRLDADLPLQHLLDAQDTPSGSPPMTPGASATRWSGRRPARRRGTTSRRSRGSGPSAPRSTCTTRTSSPAATASWSGPAGDRSGRVKVEAYLFLGCAGVLRRVGPGLLELLARPDGHDGAGAVGLPGLPHRLLRPVHRPAAAAAARGRPSRARSTRAPASWASSARTAGGRCSSAWPAGWPRSASRSAGGCS